MSRKQPSRTGSLLRSMINPRAWLDVERIRDTFLALKNAIVQLFVPTVPERVERFEEAMKRFHMTEEDVKRRQRTFLVYALFMFCLALGILVYALLHLQAENIAAMALSLVVMLITLVISFRYHFWYFQLKKRKFGCSIREWFKEGLLGIKQ